LSPLVAPAAPAVAVGVAAIRALKHGECIWRPEVSPRGPVVVVVSLPHQLVHVDRNGVGIGVSTCSTGARGHETPTGVFTILQKREEHYSSAYNNARCRICSDPFGAASRSKPGACRATRLRVDASGCRRSFPSCSFQSPSTARRSLLLITTRRIAQSWNPGFRRRQRSRQARRPPSARGVRLYARSRRRSVERIFSIMRSLGFGTTQ